MLVSWLDTSFLYNSSKDDSETLHSDSSPKSDQTEIVGFSEKILDFL